MDFGNFKTRSRSQKGGVTRVLRENHLSLMAVLFLSLSAVVLFVIVYRNLSPDPTPANAVQAFKDAGLEVGDTYPVDAESQQASPLPKTYEEGVRFVIPSSCADDECGGRVFSFENENDLSQVYNYYDALKTVPLIGGGYVYRNDLLVLQIGSDTPKAKAEEYREVFEDL